MIEMIGKFWPWIAAGGVVAAIAVFVLAPAAALRFVGEIAGWFMDKGGQFVRWLRKPGNGRRFVFGAVMVGLFVWAATASLSAWQRNGQIVVVTQERDAAVTARDEALAGIEAERLSWAEQEAKIAAAQRRAWEAMERAQVAAGKAQEAARQARLASNKRNADWLRVYEGRGDVCKAAEEALDVACKSVGRL